MSKGIEIDSCWSGDWRNPWKGLGVTPKSCRRAGELESEKIEQEQSLKIHAKRGLVRRPLLPPVGTGRQPAAYTIFAGHEVWSPSELLPVKLPLTDGAAPTIVRCWNGSCAVPACVHPWGRIPGLHCSPRACSSSAKDAGNVSLQQFASILGGWRCLTRWGTLQTGKGQRPNAWQMSTATCEPAIRCMTPAPFSWRLMGNLRCLCPEKRFSQFSEIEEGNSTRGS